MVQYQTAENIKQWIIIQKIDVDNQDIDYVQLEIIYSHANKEVKVLCIFMNKVLKLSFNKLKIQVLKEEHNVSVCLHNNIQHQELQHDELRTNQKEELIAK
ncbi:unnamed protein product [Paramecium sonneborni]|uniref:Uncharacterized protein n=1 Tax=Paramecium sonneborni TaxID=65129 RepID=A0A8S1R5E2_9CILI|nr:unnamed protein product [Paramecium sonneborni]